ncbi:MAG: ribosome-associated translation inhibitor RaiA [Clostridia bacterium]|nr:ribosome-associated translation inhibitor RaiA [Clostridia bacterium]
MKTQIMSKNYNVSEKLEKLITSKIDKLDRYFEDSATAKVVCSKVANDLFKLELTIKDKGLLFRSEVMTDNMYQNIDLALPKVERQIVKYSSKLKDKLRKNSSIKDLVFNDELDDTLDLNEVEISKIKNFNIGPLSVSEAVMELENSDHSFYVYLNPDNGRVNIIYKRRQGGYGLLDPTID